jgi:hypothetical protein
MSRVNLWVRFVESCDEKHDFYRKLFPPRRAIFGFGAVDGVKRQLFFKKCVFGLES